jgi:CHAT domain-containing protein
MTPTPEVQERLRRYLLGQLDDDDREDVEKSVLSSNETYQELLVLEDEMVDEYLSGELMGDDRSAFEKHFLATLERKEKLRFGRALRRYASAQVTTSPREDPHDAPSAVRSWRSWRVPNSPFSSPLTIAAFALVAVVVAVGVWRVFFYQSEVDKGLLALNRAYREQRPVESRISALSYAPFVQTRGQNDQRVDALARDRAELILNTAAGDPRNSAAHHALGQVYLAEKRFDDAIAQFEVAVKSDSKNAQLYSDLGAAWLEKGKIDRGGKDAGKGIEEFARSLENLIRALDLNPNLLEALFNRALVHQEMGLPEAQQDWKKYLEKDSTSSWAMEARQNLKYLEEQRKSSQTKEELLREFLSAYEDRDDAAAWRVISVSREGLSRKLIWEQLLDQYLEATTERRSADKTNSLQALSYEGELEYRKAGDRYVSDLARFYQRSSEAQEQTLKEARRLMRQGHDYYFQHEMAKATEAYRGAREIFARLEDRCETQYAQHWIGYTYYELGKTQQALTILEELAQALERENYQWLLMRTLHIASSSYHNLDEYSTAISYNRRALSVAERIDDKVGVFDVASVLIFQYGSTGNHTQALDYIRPALSAMNDCPLSEIQSARYYSIVALALYDAGLYYAAIDYEKEALRRAIDSNVAQNVSVRYARLGIMYAKVGNFAEASQNLDLAYAAGKLCPDESTRKELMGFSALETGHLYREQGQFANAISRYDQTIAVTENIRFQYDAYEAHKNRLFCYLALGEDHAAAEELKTTLSINEKYRSKIVEGDNRNTFFDIQQSVYDLAIDFSYSRQRDSRTAFQYSEDSRSRSLLDSITDHIRISATQDRDISFKSVAQPLSLTEIQRRLPANVLALEYAVLNDKLVIWVVSQTQFTAVDKRISQRDLETTLNEYLRLVAAPSSPHAEIQNRGKALYEILIQPIEPLLDRSKSIYFIPDKFLNSFPFGTLISPASNRFLIEDYLLGTSPSASLLVVLSELAQTKDGHNDERLLSVGNPRFDHDVFPTLADLPAAKREAEQVAAFYKSSRLLTEDAATKRNVSSEMPISDVIHFALHSVADEQSAMRSKFVLAKDSLTRNDSSDFDGSFPAYEIYRLKLPRTRLAVLSACHTGAERIYGGEGMISLARPFLAAHVPLVIVSLWSVDSDPTSELMVSFHKHRKQENLSTAEALRRAQLDMLKRPEERFHSPACWGAFELIGGSTAY